MNLEMLKSLTWSNITFQETHTDKANNKQLESGATKWIACIGI